MISNCLKRHQPGFINLLEHFSKNFSTASKHHEFDNFHAYTFPKKQKLNCFVAMKNTHMIKLAVAIQSILERFGNNVYFDKSVVDGLEDCNYKPDKSKPPVSQSSFVPFEFHHEKEIDLAITIGGDGTILWAAQKFKNRTMPPLFAINRGRIGYMCNFALPEFEAQLVDVLTKISKGETVLLEYYPRLQCTIKNDPYLIPKKYIAVNEFMVDRGASSRILKAEIKLNQGVPLFSFEGDGILISTPLGSTAYNLSSGGPIVYPHIPAMTIVPMAPKFASRGPVVLPIDFEVEIDIKADSKVYGWIASDGENRIELHRSSQLLIKRSDYDVPFIIGNYDSPLARWRAKTKFILERD